MVSRILVTGSGGLIGRALCRALLAAGHDVVPFDLCEGQDVRNEDMLAEAMPRCSGIVHLAAVSRVAWCERDSYWCKAVNVEGTRTVARLARESSMWPWLLFASSREVYGHVTSLPVGEDAPLRPVNVYGRAKVEGETVIGDARHAGVRTAIVRLSNVYGDIRDHADRVVPAFARAAVEGGVLKVEGTDSGFDFVHLYDAVRGLMFVVRALASGEKGLPPVHLVTGVMTKLRRLADLAIELAGTNARVKRKMPRTYDVSWFQGDPRRSRSVLGWEAQVPLRNGLAQLIRDFRTMGVINIAEATA